MLHNLGERQTLVPKPIPSGKPRGKPSHPQPDQNQRQHPEFLLPLKVLSLGNHRQPPNGHPGRSQALSLEFTGVAGAAIHHMASGARRSHKCTGQYVHDAGKRPITSFSWVSVSCVGWTKCFLCPNFHMIWEGPSPNPFCPQARLTGFFYIEPPPATTLTSMAHVPAFPWSHP